MELVLERMVEVIRIPGTKDNPGEMENQAPAVHNLLLVGSYLPEVHIPGADRLDTAGMVDKQVGSEALLRDAKPGIPIHARDRWFVDQQVALAQKH